MADLEDGPQDLVSPFSFVRSVLRIFHFIAEFQQCILDIIKAIGWWFAVARRTYWWHFSSFDRLIDSLIVRRGSSV